MLVAGGGREPTLLDFFVAGADAARGRRRRSAELQAVDVSFGDADQVFHIGPASCGVYGTPAASARPCAAGARPLDGARRARRRARARGGRAQRRAGLRGGDPRRPADLDARVRRAVGSARAASCARARCCATPSWARRCCGSAREGAEPFYRGDIAAAVCDWLRGRGGSLSAEDLAGYAAIVREPVRRALPRPRDPHQPAALRRRHAARLRARAARPRPARRRRSSGVVEAMDAAQSERTPEFVEGLERGGLPRALPALRASARRRTSR